VPSLAPLWEDPLVRAALGAAEAEKLRKAPPQEARPRAVGCGRAHPHPPGEPARDWKPRVERSVTCAAPAPRPPKRPRSIRASR
jgi:hypothetical protein